MPSDEIGLCFVIIKYLPQRAFSDLDHRGFLLNVRVEWTAVLYIKKYYFLLAVCTLYYQLPLLDRAAGIEYSI